MTVRRELILFFVLLLVYSYFIQNTGTDQLSRLDVILAIGRDHTVAIDGFSGNTLGKTVSNGHTYSDKSPGIAVLGVPAYVALNAILRLDTYPWDAYSFWQYLTYLMTVCTVALPSAILAVVFLHFLRRLSGNENANLAVTLGLALATPFFPYATMFFTHNLAAALGFGAFYLAFLFKEREGGPGLLALGGLLLGLGAFVEYPTAMVAVALAVYLWLAAPERRRGLVWLAAGMAPGLLLLLAYNQAAFGSPFQVGYTQAGPLVGEHQKGLLGITLPSLSTAWELTFGWKGLFVYSPLMLLAPLGLWQMARHPRWRAEGILFSALVIVFFVANTAYFSPFGALAVGPRFLIAVFPFLAAPLVLLWPRLRWPLLALGLLSFGLMLAVTVLSPYVRSDFANPWLEFWLPQLRKGYVVLTVPHVRFGLRHLFSLGLLGVFLAGVGGATVALGRLRGKQPALYENGQVALLAIVIGAYLLFGFPLDPRHPTQVPPRFISPATEQR